MAPSHQEIFESSYILQDAMDLALEAILAAHRCQDNRARRLRRRALAKAQEAEDKLATATQEARDFYYTDNVVVRILISLRADMKRINKLLKQCIPQSQYPFSKAGSFAASKVVSPPRSRKRIEITFTLDKEVKCENLCLISTYYIEEDATGKIRRKPSDGYISGFDPLMGGLLPDTDAADGTIIDAPARVLDANLQLVPSTSPCMPTSKKTGLKITAEDAPFFVKSGHTAYFETCLVCLDKRPKFEILGCMRWRHRTGSLKILKKKGAVDGSKASEGFVRALELYLANHP